MSENQLTMRKGGLAIPPAPGDMAAFWDTDGTLKQIDPTGTVAKIGGASASIAPWFANVAGAVQTLLPALTSVLLADDCTTLAHGNFSMQTANGSAAVSISTAKPGGVFELKTGSTANSFRILQWIGQVSEPQINNLSTSKFAIAVRSQIIATPATFFAYMANMSDQVTANSFVGLNQATSPTNYVMQLGGSAAVDLGVPFDFNWHTLLLLCDGANATAYLGSSDGTGLVQMGAGQPQSRLPNNPGCYDTYCGNLAAAANMQFDLDKVLLLGETPTV